MIFMFWLACAVAVSVLMAAVVCLAESLGYCKCSTDPDTIGAYRDDYD